MGSAAIEAEAMAKNLTLAGVDLLIREHHALATVKQKPLDFCRN